MGSWRLPTRLAMASLLVALGALCLGAWIGQLGWRQSLLDAASQTLGERLTRLDGRLRAHWAPPATSELQAEVHRFAETTGGWYSVVRADGAVLADTAGHDDPRSAPELQAALAGRPSLRIHAQSSTGARLLNYAQPVRDRDRVIGALRVTVASEPWEGSSPWLLWGLPLCSAVVALVAWGVTRGLYRPLAEHLAELGKGIQRFGDNLELQRALTSGVPECRELAESFDRMQRGVRQRLDQVLRENQEKDAVLASMVEGVIAVDKDERLISMNRAAARLLGTGLSDVQGRSLHEVVRNLELRRFVANSLVAKSPIEGDLLLRGPHERTLQAHGTALRDAQGRGIGAVIVLNDVSRLRQLENMRRDFAANVSHELKTPITSIKGFVETLLEGAKEDPEACERFLHIIQRQAERLDAIIEDLLSLSKIEQEAEAGEIEMQLGPLGPVLESARGDVHSKAQERGVRVECVCDPSVRCRMNGALLQQAVTNLLDNAIKYSEPEGEVRVVAEQTATATLVRVQDHGCGIPEEHLPRVFERFYRVDRARSRKLGGTGLGLAIVKHIAQAHRGHVSVESTPGRGSVFTLHLPRA